MRDRVRKMITPLLVIAIVLLLMDIVIGLLSPSLYYSYGLPIFKISRTVATPITLADLPIHSAHKKEFDDFVIHPLATNSVGLRDKMLRRLHTPVMRAKLVLSPDGTTITIVGFLYAYVLGAFLAFILVFKEFGTWFAVIMGGIIFFGIYVSQASRYRRLALSISGSSTSET